MKKFNRKDAEAQRDVMILHSINNPLERGLIIPYFFAPSRLCG